MNLLLALMEVAIVFTAVWLVMSQVVWPLIWGERLFPLFRRRRVLLSELADLNTQMTDEEIAAEVRRLQGQLNQMHAEEEQEDDEPIRN